MNRPQLALGIPVFNQVTTIDQTVASVLAQNEPFDEIVIVDNHSTDGTYERLQAFSSKIQIIRPPKHLGMVVNWNYCVSQMSAEWFSLLSGDDLIKPNFAKAVRKVIRNHSAAALIRTDWDVIDTDGNVQSVHHQFGVSRITFPPKTWQEQLQGPRVSFAAFAARRDHWQAVGGFPEDFYLFQDWMFWIKLAPLGSFIRIPISLAQYRSSNRPELDRKRARLRLFDEHLYLMDVLPSLPWYSARWDKKIMKVRQRRLTDLLNYLTQNGEVINDEDCRTRLKILAAASSMTKIYESWLVNQKPITLPLVERLVAKLKSFVRQAVT